MLKLLFTLGAFLVLSLAVLGLRHHRLEITSQTAKLHDQIKAREQTLWDQRVEIARQTNPLALAVNLKSQGINPGDAMQPRDTKPIKPKVGAGPHVETDLVAPIRESGSGHSDARRPRLP